VTYYEDVPYAVEPDVVEQRLSALGPRLSFHPDVVTVEDQLDAKVAAVQAYTTQLRIDSNFLRGSSVTPACLAKDRRSSASGAATDRGALGQRLAA
jgi:hypothetical protein